ncbi:MAG: Ppx/GppA phosphatase family protein [Bacteroidia bacterium]
MERIALIDLGTNTFHLLITEIRDRDQLVELGKYKAPVKLGEEGMPGGAISEAAYQRGISTLRDFKQVIEAAGVTTVLAFATSAIRSATNGKAFVQEAYELTGIRIRVINGNEEASLIHEGVKNGVSLPKDEPVLLVDIGGGSVEFIVSLNGEALLLRSLNIGAARLLEVAKPSDPIEEAEIEVLEEHLDRELQQLVEELREFELEWLIGSSGTFETLAAVAAYENGDLLSAEQLNGYRFSNKLMKSVLAQIISSRRDDRIRMRGMDPLRVDMIVVASVLVRLLCKKLGLKRCMVSSYALKDGMLFRHIREKKNRLNRLMGAVDRDVRAKAVQNLARHFPLVGPQSAGGELATSFRQLESLSTSGARPRPKSLQYSAALFNIGHYSNASSHHKHGLYIIMNTALSGFSTNELVQLANIVRYHRKSLPKLGHYHWSIMSEESQQRVMLLGGMLRLAINLDRGRRRLISGLEVEEQDGKVQIRIKSTENVEMELGFAREQKEMLELALGQEVEIH